MIGHVGFVVIETRWFVVIETRLKKMDYKCMLVDVMMMMMMVCVSSRVEAASWARCSPCQCSLDSQQAYCAGEGLTSPPRLSSEWSSKLRVLSLQVTKLFLTHSNTV